jgi:hypothetical protein
MKGNILTVVFLTLLFSARGQNVQLHYDMGKGRGYFTSTIEMFRPDNWGSTFFFIDMDYNVGDIKGMSLAYLEIARAIKLYDSHWALHGEYNGGLFQIPSGEALQIEDSWLAGLEYSMSSSDFSKGLTLQALYKYIRGKHDAAFQLTAVWFWDLAGGKISFTGFADWWREDFQFDQKTTKFVLQAEPQLWYNINKNFALGSEAEVDVNFGGLKGFHIMPTIGGKVTF